MKALILRGKNRGDICEVHQFCNDWFMLEHANPEVANKPFWPSSLAFTVEGMDELKTRTDTGMLFHWFEPKTTKRDYGRFIYTFKRRNYVMEQSKGTGDAGGEVRGDTNRPTTE